MEEFQASTVAANLAPERAEVDAAPSMSPAKSNIELSGHDELVLAERRQGYVAATIADRLGLPDARVRASLSKLRKAGYSV